MHQNLRQVDLSFSLSFSCFEFILERGINARRFEAPHIQQGDFLSSGSQMQIVVKLAKPLVSQHRLLDNRQFSNTSVNNFRNEIFTSVILRLHHSLELFSYFLMTIRSF